MSFDEFTQAYFGYDLGIKVLGLNEILYIYIYIDRYRYRYILHRQSRFLGDLTIKAIAA